MPINNAYILILLSAMITAADQLSAQSVARPLIQSKAFTVYGDSIVQQQKFVSKIISPAEIRSNYQSPANLFKSADITFKFSINGKDNEMVSGTDHHFRCNSGSGACVTPLITFGKQLTEEKHAADHVYLKPNTSFRIRLDMRNVFEAFDRLGYYTTFNGEKIFKEDFKGVFVAGNTAPLIWDFDNLVNHPQLQLIDPDGHHIYETTLVLNQQEDEKKTESHWQLSKDLSAFPRYHSPYPVSDALYNLSLEEMIRAVEPDSTFRTGKEWAGVWTRDISYSILLSMACLQPEVAMKSLLRKVNHKQRIIQDTGTGGAYPCSTDRMIWAAAAWEVYLVTGNKDWLEQAYVIIKNSIEDDLSVVYDPQTGLVKGESSFLDWREQTYPKWMQPADIFESECLGTNAVHYKANEVLAQMAFLLHHQSVAVKHRAIAAQIKNGINKYLWMPDKGYYAQYLYGRNHKILSPRSEALGEALCVYWDIADHEQQKLLMEKTPVTDFGITCIYPQIPDIPPYHNNAIWPFVQSFWLWASVKAAHQASVLKSIGDIYRPAALFLTNKENFVAENGDFNGTQINSSNMLWSLSGNISIVLKVFFGIRFNEDHLSFSPFVPASFDGKRSLSGFRYRDALLDVVMEGHGNRVASFKLDNQVLPDARIPSSLQGKHSVWIELAGNDLGNQQINSQPLVFSPAAPQVSWENNVLSWQPVAGARAYQILKNGKKWATTQKDNFRVEAAAPAEYQVISLDAKDVASFASEPVLIYRDPYLHVYEAEAFADKAVHPCKGFSGAGFVEISTTRNRDLDFPVRVEHSGWYGIDFRYANGNGPTNTDNKCAIRTMKVDGVPNGSCVFPQRGVNEWSNWGFSNAVKVYLQKGMHHITLTFEQFNDNMNLSVNQAMIDYLRLLRWEQ